MRLYYFTKAEHGLENIRRRRIKIARIKDLNDPYDAVNDKFGKKTMVIASEGFRRKHETKFDHRTPRYTTRIDELPVVTA